ncbi:hypothetical protein SprV_0100248700 [Sparganum proliferum]
MHRTPLPDDQHLLSPSYAGEGGLNALPVAALADAGLRLVRRRNQQDVLVTKAICYADGWVDHGLIISKMRLRLQPRRRPQGRRPPCNLNIVLLNLPAPPSHVSNQLTLHLEELQVPEDDTVETRWCQLWNAIQFTVLGVHGRRISPTPGQVQQKRRSHQQPAHREVQEIKGTVSERSVHGSAPSDISELNAPPALQPQMLPAHRPAATPTASTMALPHNTPASNPGALSPSITATTSTTSSTTTPSLTPTTSENTSNTPSATILTTSSDVNSASTCPHCDRTFISGVIHPPHEHIRSHEYPQQQDSLQY